MVARAAEVRRVERDEREEAFARRFTAWILELLHHGERPLGARLGEAHGVTAVREVSERDLAFREPEPVTDLLELGGGLIEQVARARETPLREVGEAEQQKAPAVTDERIGQIAEMARRALEPGAGRAVIALLMIDLSDDELALRDARF